MSKALEAGFVISTGYGQVADKLMPISDTATLKKFADLIRQELLQSIITEVEGKKKKMSKETLALLKEHDPMEIPYKMLEDHYYNKALDDSIIIIKSKME